MNLQEFFRQAHYMRDYTPTVTGSTAMTVSGVTVVAAKYLILGRVVIGTWNLDFTTGGVAASRITISTPTAIKTNVSPAFTGRVDTAGVSGVGDYYSTTEIRLARYDVQVFALGANSIVRGWFFYENGEPVV